MSSWFRVDALIGQHPKVLDLSSDSVRWTLVLVWAAGKVTGRSGRWESLKHIVACIGGRPARHIRELISTGLLDEEEDGSITVHDWNLWQSQSPDDPTRATRQKRYRERHVTALRNAPSNGNVTPSRNGQTYTETETENSSPSGKGRARPVPPSVRVFRDAAHCFPNRSQWPRIAEVVGEDLDRLAAWQQHVTDWIGHGWNPQNLTGMLEAFTTPHTCPTHIPQESKSRRALRAYIAQKGLDDGDEGRNPGSDRPPCSGFPELLPGE